MNKKLVLRLSIIGVFFVIFFGSFFHFTFDLSGKNFLVALFSAVNESVWEHMKLSTFPLLIWALIELWFFKKKPQNFWLAKNVEIISAIIFMIAFFYTQEAILGKSLLFLDISSFILGVILGKSLGFLILFKVKKPIKNNLFWLFPLAFLILFFFITTFIPPRLGIFKESLDGTYGFFQVK